MKRKLRKSLSWLLTFAMVISLFCGMIPTASAVDEPTDRSDSLEITKETTHRNGVMWGNYVEAQVEDEITYRITIENNSTTPITNVAVTDSLFNGKVSSVRYETQKHNGAWYETESSGDLTVTNGEVTIPSIPESVKRPLIDVYEPGRCIITYTYTLQRGDAAPYESQEFVNTATVAGKSDSVSITVQATGGSTNDSEFHIMNWEELKDFVREAYSLDESEKITIHAIEVNGETILGEDGSATGGFAYYTNKGDYGVQGSNGILAADHDIWKVFNDAAIVKPETVTSITVLAKTGTGSQGFGGERLEPLTIYLSEDDIVLPVDNGYITQISLTNASLDPIQPDPKPDDKYDITGFTKTLVTNEEQAAAAGAEVPGNDGKVTIPVNAEVKLLYELTVTGKAGTNFTITEDKNVELVGSDTGYKLMETETGTTITGAIPAGATKAVIYVTKSFDVDDISSNGKLTNKASIAVTDETGSVDPAVVDETVETDAKEGAPNPPSAAELEALLGDNAVLVHCTSAEFDHPELLSGLIEGSYSYEEVTGTAESASVTMKVNSAKYVEAYEAANDNKDHELNVGETDPETITFSWDGEAWSVASETPVVFTVTCKGDAWFNPTEFHIMHLNDIKQAVANAADLESAESVEIYTIYVQGTHNPNLIEGIFGEEPRAAQATGGIEAFVGSADVGFTGFNGMLAGSDWGILEDLGIERDAWKVLNTDDIIDDNTVTGITIYYKVAGNDTERYVEIPCTEFASIERLEGSSGL